MATRRQDLEALDYKNPGNLTQVIFPRVFRAVRQGVLYWRDIVADSAAQTGRTAGAAPTAQTITDNKSSFNLENDEFIDRVKVPQEDIAGMGGLLQAQMNAANIGKRNVAEAVEDLTVANVLNNGISPEADILGSLIEAVETAKASVMDKTANGKIVLVCSSVVFGIIKRYSAIIERMKFTGVLASGINDVRGISQEQLAAALNLDGVLVGPKSSWYDESSVYQDRAAVMVLPDPNVEPIVEAQAGRTIWFSPDGIAPAGDQTLFSVESFYSDDLRSEVVDVQAFAEQKLLNPELIYVLKGIDEGNVVTTTT